MSGTFADFVAEKELLEEKMPESPWHNRHLRWLEELLSESVIPFPSSVNKAVLETLGVTVTTDGQRVVMLDRQGREILTPKAKVALLQKALEQERSKREEIERRVAELEGKL